MRIDPATVKLDFGQGTTDQKLYESVVAIRTDVRTISGSCCAPAS